MDSPFPTKEAEKVAFDGRPRAEINGTESGDEEELPAYLRGDTIPLSIYFSGARETVVQQSQSFN